MKISRRLAWLDTLNSEMVVTEQKTDADSKKVGLTCDVSSFSCQRTVLDYTMQHSMTSEVIQVLMV